MVLRGLGWETSFEKKFSDVPEINWEIKGKLSRVGYSIISDIIRGLAMQHTLWVLFRITSILRIPLLNAYDHTTVGAYNVFMKPQFELFMEWSDWAPFSDKRRARDVFDFLLSLDTWSFKRVCYLGSPLDRQLCQSME